MPFTRETLEISGYRGEPVPNTFTRQAGDTSHLAIVLPGRGYTAQMPLLYYATDMLTNIGADILLVEYAYTKKPGFNELPDDEKQRWFLEDVTAAYRAAIVQRNYGRITIIGKSLGTLAMGYLLTTIPELGGAEAVWITPLLHNETLCEQIERWAGHSLFAVGTADPEHDHARFHQLQRVTRGEAVVVRGADHSLEIPGNTLASLKAVESVIHGLNTFLT